MTWPSWWRRERRRYNVVSEATLLHPPCAHRPSLRAGGFVFCTQHQGRTEQEAPACYTRAAVGYIRSSIVLALW